MAAKPRSANSSAAIAKISSCRSEPARTAGAGAHSPVLIGGQPSACLVGSASMTSRSPKRRGYRCVTATRFSTPTHTSSIPRTCGRGSSTRSTSIEWAQATVQRLQPLQPDHRRRPAHAPSDDALRAVPEVHHLDGRRHRRQVRRLDDQGLHRRASGQGPHRRRCRHGGHLRPRVRHVERFPRPRDASGHGARVQPLGPRDARELQQPRAHLVAGADLRRVTRGRRDHLRVRTPRRPLVLDPAQHVPRPQPRRFLLRPHLGSSARSRLRVRHPRVHGSQRCFLRLTIATPASPNGTPPCTRWRAWAPACR